MDVAQKTPAQEILPSPAAPVSPARTVQRVGFTLCLCYLIVLGGTFLKGSFLLDPHWQPIANDFVNVAAAGRLALDGKPADAYDWPTHKQAEVGVIGHGFENYYSWHYPPPFLFVAAALAMLPFMTAAIISLLVTLAAYVAAMWSILGRTGIFVALGFPAAIWNVTAGQNGFLTAALIGGTLGMLERRPALAGICLGLLTYKPQFGLLFPLVLIADRRWTTVLVAAAAAIALAASSWLVFGTASWQAFAHWMPITAASCSAKAMLTSPGCKASSVSSAPMAAANVSPGAFKRRYAWRWPPRWSGCAPFELKAAALAAGTLIVTPYVYMYDLVVLGVAVAFLLRHAFERGFLAGEVSGLAAACALILSFPYVKSQVGLAAVLIVLALVMQRACCAATKSTAE